MKKVIMNEEIMKSAKGMRDERKFILNSIVPALIPSANTDIYKEISLSEGYLTIGFIRPDGQQELTSKRFFEKYNISEEEAWESAFRHMERISTAFPVESFFGIPEEKCKMPAYMICYKDMGLGSAAIFSEKAASDVERLCGTRRVTLLPAGYHEALVIPKGIPGADACGDEICRLFGLYDVPLVLKESHVLTLPLKI